MKINNAEIQIDKEAFDELDITDKIDIGINLGGGITNNQTFYIKKFNQAASSQEDR